MSSILGDLSKGNALLFFPAAGYGGDTDAIYEAGSEGLYWSGTVHTLYPSYSCFLRFRSDDVYRDCMRRFLGISVRPVSD